jgi:V8-like Glu-specific endopeptidase
LIPACIAAVGLAGCAVDSTPRTGETSGEVIYGNDDRTECTGRDSVALIDKGDLTVVGNQVLVTAQTLQQYRNLCPDQRFLSQPTAGFCSGTLIGPREVLTAGHCMTNKRDCRNTRFVFGYAWNGSSLQQISTDDVYSCSRILVRQASAVDFAIIELDRDATGSAVPQEVETNAAALPVDTPLVVEGYPTGIPCKNDDGGWVRENRASSLDYFVANLDTFGGNSGSAVWAGGKVVGILVRGETDYVYYGYPEYCYRVNECPNNGCSGEDATYAFNAIEALCNLYPTNALCNPGPYCGDGNCDANEDSVNCVQDCGPQCGDGVCNGGETNAGCPQDCPAGICGDSICQVSDGESCQSCPDDCEITHPKKGVLACCGNGTCERRENAEGCPNDCG